LDSYKPNFTDNRLAEMLFRYRARNCPEMLQPEEIIKWQDFCVGRITGNQLGAGITLDEYFIQLSRLRDEASGNEVLLKQLEDFAMEKMQQLGIS
jgi:exodeoxyribonuclease I